MNEKQLELLSKIKRYHAAEFKLNTAAISMSHYPWHEQLEKKVRELNKKAAQVHGMTINFINEMEWYK